MNEVGLAEDDKDADQCTSDSDCSNGLCFDGTCLEESEEPETLDLHVLGKSCSHDFECNVEGSICTEEEKCLCKDDLVPSQNLKLCLPKAQDYGDECVESVQCLSLGASVCMNLKCVEHGSNETEDVQPVTLMLGSPCNTNEECSHLVHSVCKESICECTDDYVTSIMSNSCLVKAKFEGDECEIDKQCTNVEGAICTGNKCIKPGKAGSSLENGADWWKAREATLTAFLTAILTAGMFVV
ncbi:hypothetical protein RUM44_001813 [Polyplax serrata]|uniref:EB domain-containing protein n=1 Tax=Polyplax serrata TaxID=468196 RepID=A0ABR1AL44_POLSC